MLKRAVAKKTKKEKILAEYHRKLELLEPVKYNLPGEKVTFTAPVQPEARVVSNYSYIVSDLVRILFLTALAICAQLVLWYRYR